jgi:hypothetical protein
MFCHPISSGGKGTNNFDTLVMTMMACTAAMQRGCVRAHINKAAAPKAKSCSHIREFPLLAAKALPLSKTKVSSVSPARMN